jgi:hypothetical protein
MDIVYIGDKSRIKLSLSPTQVQRFSVQGFWVAGRRSLRRAQPCRVLPYTQAFTVIYSLIYDFF